MDEAQNVTEGLNTMRNYVKEFTWRKIKTSTTLQYDMDGTLWYRGRKEYYRIANQQNNGTVLIHTSIHFPLRAQALSHELQQYTEAEGGACQRKGVT